MEQVLITLSLIAIIIICFILCLTIVLAALGKSLGVRRLYVETLLKVFEFGRKRIKSYAEMERHRPEQGEGDLDTAEGLPGEDSVPDTPTTPTTKTPDFDQVIHRDISISATEGITIPSKRSDYNLSWRREFNISDMMYFMKCGMECIIQDDVTQRFTAEELQSWNLLTRTDNGYQFIRMKRKLNSTFSLMSHRILCRAMSATVTFHNRMKEHVENEDKLPILIFPEGTCINNTSVMMFKKGGFEVTPIVYPVAIKYDSRFGDAFWNSSKESMVRHIYNIMTSWALVADVWYLPPMRRNK
ncbi:GPAT4-like protein [Mya arenaria]|uniref:GPAT4-like protein n=1 Tax=Mya arenaria TaxID=6604 RepID=A0ABY7FQ56_MYAAR|nr:GPAT4-like protein [Mya arenaria]